MRTDPLAVLHLLPLKQRHDGDVVPACYHLFRVALSSWKRAIACLRSIFILLDTAVQTMCRFSQHSGRRAARIPRFTYPPPLATQPRPSPPLSGMVGVWFCFFRRTLAANATGLRLSSLNSPVDVYGAFRGVRLAFSSHATLYRAGTTLKTARIAGTAFP